MADDKALEAAKKQAAENREARAKAVEHHMETVGKSKPTPTQEENDIFALGGHIETHEDDGSGPDPGAVATKDMKPSGGGAGYSTRVARPAHTTSHSSS
jgi:hypothetical protein